MQLFLQNMRGYYEEKKPVGIDAFGEAYTGMVITSLEISEDNKEDNLSFEMTAVKPIMVGTKKTIVVTAVKKAAPETKGKELPE